MYREAWLKLTPLQQVYYKTFYKLCSPNELAAIVAAL